MPLMKSLLMSPVLLTFMASMAFAGEEPPKVSAEELIAEGVSLHDAGKFDEAIQRYRRALDREPDNSLALYELANTYAATKRFDLCGEMARRGLKSPGRLEGALFAMAGSCLSSAGKSQEAIRTFEEGLAKHPKDSSLNFNIAVTLAHEGKLQQAIPHLRTVIEVEPSYSSPYFGLGEIYASEGRATEGIFLLMRFVSLETNSARAAAASARVFELLTNGVSVQGGKDIKISVMTDLAELAPLDMARTLAAATMHLEEAQAQSKAQRFVSALDGFVKMTEELTWGEDGQKISSTFLWERAAKPIVQLQKQGALECFGYVLAARAGFDGAEEWLKKNSEKMKHLEAALAALRQ